jgi:hypothetical protein
MPSDVESDFAGGRPHSPVDKGKIRLFDRTIVKRAAQLRMSPIVFCNDQKTRGPFVDPVNNSRTRFAAGAGQVPKLEYQAVNQGPPTVPRSGMDHQTCRFFNHRQIIVFVDDTEGNILRLQPWPSRRLQSYFNNLIAAQAVPGLFLPIPDTDRSCPVQCLNMRSSELDKVAGEEYIQP